MAVQTATDAAVSTPPQTVFDIGSPLAFEGAVPDTVNGKGPARAMRAAEIHPESLFDLDRHWVELMDRAEDAAEAGSIPDELLLEIQDYLARYQSKVDRIAGYWRWQESIARICGEEADRFSARKKSAEGRLKRLKEMVLAFMLSRDLKRIEGQKAAIGMQANGTPSVVIDNPLQIGERFFETSVRLTKTEMQEIVYQMADGDLRGRLEHILAGDGWEINSAAVRAAIANNFEVSGARLLKGNHVRLR